MKNRKLKNSELNRKTVDEAMAAPRTPLILILDNMRSLNNIGSAFFRTADAFLIEKIYLCGITATPPHKDIQKTALGATESVAWEYIEDPVVLVASCKVRALSLGHRTSRRRVHAKRFSPNTPTKNGICPWE